MGSKLLKPSSTSSSNNRHPSVLSSFCLAFYYPYSPSRALSSFSSSSAAAPPPPTATETVNLKLISTFLSSPQLKVKQLHSSSHHSKLSSSGIFTFSKFTSSDSSQTSLHTSFAGRLEAAKNSLFGKRKSKIALMMTSTDQKEMVETASQVDEDESKGTSAQKKKLDELKFVNLLVQNLPADPIKENYIRQVEKAGYSLVMPTPADEDDQASMISFRPHSLDDDDDDNLSENDGKEKEDVLVSLGPHLVAYSPACADLFELEYPVDDAQKKRWAKVFGGFEVVDGMIPYAQCYGGHQFGNWASQLGDGRAINLGDVVNSKGERWEMQLKGAGPTPYSRRADGRAVMRSSVREFLCSEAMYHLGIPTTRALTLVSTGAKVLRDHFYDGNPKLEPGAVVCRVANSFIRIGTFELPSSRQDYELLKKIADFTIEYYYPHLRDLTEDKESHENKYLQLVKEVMQCQAKMVSMWQAVGFVHGVMNTDNFSIIGDTIDYGPYGFLDIYDPSYTPNTTDIPGRRYMYSNQPKIAYFNCLMLAQALLPLMSLEPAQEVVNQFAKMYEREWNKRLEEKLGLMEWNGDEDKALVQELLQLMEESKTDFTNTFRNLSRITSDLADAESDDVVLEPLDKVLKNISAGQEEQWIKWVRKYSARVASQSMSDEERKERMNRRNPKYILRNYLAQEAIVRAEKGDFSEIETLLRLLQKPFDEQPEMEKYAQDAPDWSFKRGVYVNSCSS